MNAHHPEIIVIESSDEEIVIESDDEEKPPPGGYSSSPSILRIIINRRPRVLARSRYFQGGIFTPSKKELKECKEIIKNQLQSLDSMRRRALACVVAQIFFCPRYISVPAPSEAG